METIDGNQSVFHSAFQESKRPKNTCLIDEMCAASTEILAAETFDSPGVLRRKFEYVIWKQS